MIKSSKIAEMDFSARQVFQAESICELTTWESSDRWYFTKVISFCKLNYNERRSIILVNERMSRPTIVAWFASHSQVFWLLEPSTRYDHWQDITDDVDRLRLPLPHGAGSDWGDRQVEKEAGHPAGRWVSNPGSGHIADCSLNHLPAIHPSPLVCLVHQLWAGTASQCFEPPFGWFVTGAHQFPMCQDNFNTHKSFPLGHWC